MNLFTDHNFGRYADDGFGDLIKLTREQVIIAIIYSINYDDCGPQFYD